MGCPGGGPKMISLKELYKEQTIYVTWGHFENAYHCKILIKGQEGVNGKIVMDVTSNENAASWIYLQPNNFNEKQGGGTRGIVENNMIYQN